jgi:hypothetical protein
MPNVLKCVRMLAPQLESACRCPSGPRRLQLLCYAIGVLYMSPKCTQTHVSCVKVDVYKDMRLKCYTPNVRRRCTGVSHHSTNKLVIIVQIEVSEL